VALAGDVGEQMGNIAEPGFLGTNVAFQRNGCHGEVGGVLVDDQSTVCKERTCEKSTR
jgi:hypothetical protein